MAGASAIKKSTHSIFRAITEYKCQGLLPGDLLFLCLHNSIRFAICFFAGSGAGGCPVPLSANIQFNELAALVAKFKPAAIVVPEENSNDFRDLTRISPRLKLLTDEQVCSTAREIAPSFEHSEFAYGLLTSGTTGIPKLIRRRHQDIILGWASYARAILGMDARDIILSTAPFCFGYGLGSGLIFPLLSGAASAFRSANRAPMADVADKKPTLIFSQPNTLKDLLACGYPQPFKQVRATVSAGERLPETLPQPWLSRFGHPILDAYGTTEVGHIFLSQSLERQLPGSVGRPVPGFRVETVDKFGKALAAGKLGLLKVQGPAPIGSYYLDDVASKAAFLNDGILTVDLATISTEGDVFIFGRASEVAITPSGVMVSLSKLDEAIAALPFVKDAYVEWVDAAEASSAPIATVLLREGHVPSEVLQGIRAAVRRHLNGLAITKLSVRFVDNICRSSNGKLLRSTPRSKLDAQFKC